MKADTGREAESGFLHDALGWKENFHDHLLRRFSAR